MPIPHKVIQRAARNLHAKGIEMTPEQVGQEHEKAYKTIRTEMRERGWILPEDDEHMLAVLVAMRQNKPVLSRKTEAGMEVAHPDFVGI